MLSNNSSSVSLIFREKNSAYHTKAINRILFNTPHSFYSGARDSLIKLWAFNYDSNTINHRHNYEHHFNWINDLALSKANSLLFSCSNDQTICLWDTNAHSLHSSIRNIHKDYITAIKYNDNKEVLYSAGLDGYLHAISLESGYPFSTICDNQNESIYSIDSTSDGNEILVSKYNNVLVLYDARSSKQALSVLRGHKDIIRSVYLSPDCKNAISASSDKTIKIWDVSKAKAIQSFDFHSESVMSLYVNEEFTRVISGSKNGEIYLIDLKRLIYTKLDQLSEGVLSIGMNPSESRLLLSSTDNRLYSYQIKKDPPSPALPKGNQGKDKASEETPTGIIQLKGEKNKQSALIVKDEIIGYTLMKNKIYALLQYKDNSSAVFNLMKMKQIARLNDMPYVVLTEKLKEIDKTTLKTWCTVDIKLGCLMMTITEDNYDSNPMNFDLDFIEKILEKQFVVNSETKFLLTGDDSVYANNKKTEESIPTRLGTQNRPGNNGKKSFTETQSKGMNHSTLQNGNQGAVVSCGKYFLNELIGFHMTNFLTSMVQMHFHIKDAKQFLKEHNLVIGDVDSNAKPMAYLVIINKKGKDNQVSVSQCFLGEGEDLMRFPSFCYSNEQTAIMKRLLLLENQKGASNNENLKIIIDKSSFSVPYINREDVQKANIASTVSVNKLKTFIAEGLVSEKLIACILKDIKDSKLTKEQKEQIEQHNLDDKKIFIDLVINGIVMKPTDLALRKIKDLLFPSEDLRIVVKYVNVLELINRRVIKLN